MKGGRHILRRHECHQGLPEEPGHVLEHVAVVAVHDEEQGLARVRVQVARVQAAAPPRGRCGRRERKERREKKLGLKGSRDRWTRESDHKQASESDRATVVSHGDKENKFVYASFILFIFARIFLTYGDSVHLYVLLGLLDCLCFLKIYY